MESGEKREREGIERELEKGDGGRKRERENRGRSLAAEHGLKRALVTTLVPVWPAPKLS